MEDNSSTNNFFLNIKKTINNNLKLIVIILSVLFLLFLLLQTYNYFIKQSTLKNSISFYKAISINTNLSCHKRILKFATLKKTKNVLLENFLHLHQETQTISAKKLSRGSFFCNSKFYYSRFFPIVQL